LARSYSIEKSRDCGQIMIYLIKAPNFLKINSSWLLESTALLADVGVYTLTFEYFFSQYPEVRN